MSKSLYNEPLQNNGLEARSGETAAETLKKARLNGKRSLADIAQEIRIPMRYLEAIEKQNLAKLPGITYALGYVRAYANYLGLDSQDIVTKFKREIAQGDNKTNLVFPTPTAGNNQPGLKIFLVCFGIILLAYLGWASLSQQMSGPSIIRQNIVQKFQGFFQQETHNAAIQTPILEPDIEKMTFAAPVSDPPQLAQPTGASNAEKNEADGSIVANKLIDQQNSQQPIPQAPPQNQGASPEEVSGPADQNQAEAVPAKSENNPAIDGPATEISSPSPSDANGMANSLLLPDMPALENPEDSQEKITPENLTNPPQQITAHTMTDSTSLQSDRKNDAGSGPDTARQGQARTYGENFPDTRIILKATHNTWVEIIGEADERLLTQLLKVGDIYYVPNKPSITMTTGNAGGLEIQVDGQILRPLGPLGAVKRDIKLVPKALLESQQDRS